MLSYFTSVKLADYPHLVRSSVSNHRNYRAGIIGLNLMFVFTLALFVQLFAVGRFDGLTLVLGLGFIASTIAAFSGLGNESNLKFHPYRTSPTRLDNFVERAIVYVGTVKRRHRIQVQKRHTRKQVRKNQRKTEFAEDLFRPTQSF